MIRAVTPAVGAMVLGAMALGTTGLSAMAAACCIDAGQPQVPGEHVDDGVAHTREQRMNIDEEQALAIARRDARTVYGDLQGYAVTARLAAGHWQIDYELADPNAQGGGPHYVISADTGAVVSKRYEQ